MIFSTPPVGPGCLVEYLHDSQPLLGFVQEEQGRQFRILNIKKRQVKLAISRILPWIGPKYPNGLSRSEILEKLQVHNVKRQEIQESIDPGAIWEISAEEVTEATSEWFADLLWNSPDEDQVAAVGRMLLENKVFFKFQPPKFRVFETDTVQAKQAEQEQQRKKRNLLSQGQSFVHTLWEMNQAEEPKPLPELPPEIETELKDLFLTGISDPEDPEFLATWKILSKGLPEDSHLPLRLAESWGLVPRHYNYLLAQADYEWADNWATEFSREIEAQVQAFKRFQEPPEVLNLISIDSPSTTDIDDAFLVEQTSSGFQLTLALAYPVLAWEFDSSLDQKVLQRVSSLYLPEGSAHMLPEQLGTQLFSLHATQIKPVLLFEARLNSEGLLLDFDFRTTWTRILENMTYAQAENQLEAGQSLLLSQALELAEHLRNQRIKNGAVIIEQEEPDIILEPRADDCVISILAPSLYPRAQLIVSEFMILANHAAACWAKERSLPLLFRTQDITLPSDRAGVWTDPVAIHHLIRELSSAKISTASRPHASLGLNCYAPVTSPLRRYPDLMNIAQINSQLKHKTCIWTQDELEAKLPYLSVRLQAVNHVQRNRSRYWKLLYLQRHCKRKHWSGIVVAITDKQVMLALPQEQILIPGPRKLFNEKISLGDHYTLKLGKINPYHDEIKILNAWEES